MTEHPEAQQLTVAVRADDHLQGSRTAPVTLLEYGDFECVYCGQARHVVQMLQRHFGDQLCFVFRHYPLTETHPHAQRAAEAAEIAAVERRFWEMHELLFTRQRALEDADLSTYAAELGLDGVRFSHALSEGLYTAQVQEDLESGARSGVHGTPTFFINGVRHVDAYDQRTLMHVIDLALASR